MHHYYSAFCFSGCTTFSLSAHWHLLNIFCLINSTYGTCLLDLHCWQEFRNTKANSEYSSYFDNTMFVALLFCSSHWFRSWNASLILHESSSIGFLIQLLLYFNLFSWHIVQSFLICLPDTCLRQYVTTRLLLFIGSSIIWSSDRFTVMNSNSLQVRLFPRKDKSTLSSKLTKTTSL